MGTMVELVTSVHGGCSVLCTDGSEDVYDACIISIHAQDALKILGKQSTLEEMRILGAFQCISRDIFLHHDKSLMPHNQSVWSSWNFMRNTNNGGYITYWLNEIQNLEACTSPFFVTLSPPNIPNDTLLKWTVSHPIPSVAAMKALQELKEIQGSRKIWFSGVYLGNEIDDNGYKAGITVAHAILGKKCTISRNKMLVEPSLALSGARFIVTRFFQHHIVDGCLIFMEKDGTIHLFEGKKNKNQRKVVLKVHNYLFYLKIATEADIGLANAYINGDFSFVDEQDGILSLFMMLIDNRDVRKTAEKKSFSREWWSPLFFTSAIWTTPYLLRHMSRRNTIKQARINISRHYDLSNDFFSLFMDETMSYSCAIFKTEEEDLKDAQLRKISLIIEKARVNSTHDVLEIGCGWGSLAVEIVKQTGCKYTGITLSKEQLRYARRKAEESGLQDRITFLLCDYRQLPRTQKYDRIVIVEMFEAVGHEYMEEFFSCCESLLAEDGVVVHQCSAIPDERYDEHRRSTDFMKEYIFHGGCLPSVRRLTSAMAATSRFCIEHLENIGMNYYHTLKCWRANFRARRSDVLELGFDEKFIRTWEYYFDYCAAGFKTRTVGNYQIVLSRPGNVKAFGDRPALPPSAH